ncbi:MAG TPA: prolyl oligopeptidase family serine peptidase [Gemmatimonadaceae bacterium]|nr:prolyl oligopeptidase family serine peptidase [Gemmatimonadaceae bacterium]
MPHAGHLSASVLLFVAIPLLAQQPGTAATVSATTDRAVLPAADYSRIETLGESALSPDGKWVVYDVRRVSGGTMLHYQAVAGGAGQQVPLGEGGAFTNNSRWLLYTISRDTTRQTRRRARRRRGPTGRAPSANAADSIHDQVGIVDLHSGAVTVEDDIQSFSLSEDGVHVALRRYAPRGSRSHGADLVVRDLARGTDVTFGNVSDFAWSDDGALLAMAIDVDGSTGSGVQLLDVATGALRSLDSRDAMYTGLAWRDHSRDLAVFRSRHDTAFADTSEVVIAWRGLGTRHITKQSYDFAADSALSAGLRVASYRQLRWSPDGTTLFFGMAPRTPAPSDIRRGTTAVSKPAQVEVWHWKDLREYHQQDRDAQRDRRRTLLTAWRVGARHAVPLTDDYFATVQLADSGSRVIVTNETPYFMDVISGRAYHDVYAVDLATGQRTRVLTKVPFEPEVSPTGRYLLYMDDNQWWSYDRTTGARANLTGAIHSVFVNMEDDHPVAVRRPYGVAGWTSGEKSVILEDRYDLWQVNPDGSHAVRLTRGREDSTVYRVEQLDPDAYTIDAHAPIWLSATGEYNKKSGFAELTIGKAPRRLLWVDKGVTSLDKASDADVLSYVIQTYEDSPDLFVSHGAFNDTVQLSHTNQFLDQYAWGKQVLMNYVNGHGDTLQMMLTYPVNYRAGTRYPMVVYYYEKLSQGFHRFVVPTERAVYNTSVFSQNGYFVLRPDIKFRPRDAGFSGLDCVISAVKAVLATGMVDPKRVGNMGHSWGGYQSAFYAVHDHGLFAATIAGAPLTDFISMYGYTSFNTGRPETGHFETGQERMQVPLWDDPQAYMRNSTVFAVDSLQTPLLLEEGDADGNVNYWQSMELYNFGRRLGKHVILLLYHDENHNVARPESQRDYHTRQLQWFAHYLKGEPAADWITNGETYLTRQKILAAAARRAKAPRRARTAATTASDGAGGPDVRRP